MGTAGALVGLVVLLLVLGALLALLQDRLRDPLLRWVSVHSARQIRVDGQFKADLLHRYPTLIAENVTIFNPPWMQMGQEAFIRRLVIRFDLPHSRRHWFGIRRLEMDGAVLTLVRDAAGRANWQWSELDSNDTDGPPLIRSLSMPEAHVDLRDEHRHLHFTGLVNARERGRQSAPPWLTIDGSGELNGHAATFAINADPLATVDRTHPYRFSFDERSDDSHLWGNGVIARPFDFRAMDTAFRAAGPDMTDLYLLTGVRLPDTGTYTLSGALARKDAHFQFNSLEAHFGHSDLGGTIGIDVTAGRSRITGSLQSRVLVAGDLGKRAAGRIPPAAAGSPSGSAPGNSSGTNGNSSGSTPGNSTRNPTSGPLFLSTKPFVLSGLRQSDSQVRFEAQSLELAGLELHDVLALVSIERGVLNVAPLTASLYGGRLSGRIGLDATRDIPRGELELSLQNARLSGLIRARAGDPPLDGLIGGRLRLVGNGKSIHAMAADADGRVSLVIPRGTMRASLAEMTGLDLSRGLGLMLGASRPEMPIRCGVASLDAHRGVLSARTLVLDTDKVLITGEGDIRLDDETLDAKLRGRPKEFRLLRVRSPVYIRGALAHPVVGVEKRGIALQAGAAVALGVLLTPVAGILAFVDPGLAKDADCAALLAQAGNSAAAR